MVRLPSGEVAAMGKRVWTVEWVACPASDGIDRLSQAVKLVIAHAVARQPLRARPVEAHAGEGQEELSYE
jgi:hypothetical protein